MPTKTEVAQLGVEEKCLPLLRQPALSLQELKSRHVQFLRVMLALDQKLPAGFRGLDASHPWMVFWPVNALALLENPLSEAELARVGATLINCQHPEGGFGGGPGQPAHLAATYSAIMALSHTGPEFWEQIDISNLLRWIISLKRADGSISVCRHGEADPRTTYCALASLRLLNVHSPEVCSGIGAYIRSCQTYEGGFANQPFGEAHGGYAFCSVATLMLLDPEDPRSGLKQFCNHAKLQRWLVSRQDLTVPGFSGRTNKLVDGCYSHWVGGCWPLIEQITSDGSLFSRKGLRDYIVHCCQIPQGGLCDKPGTRPDAYHTNYVLCGLSVARYSYEMRNNSVFDWEASLVPELAADTTNAVPPFNPVFGVPLQKIQKMHAWAVANKAPEPEVVPSSKEYQGFALYVSATILLLAYLAWAWLPAETLRSLQITYFPSRWWAVAVPAFFLMTWLYAFIAVPSYNTEKLTFPPNAPQTVGDRDTKVQDIPLVEVNKALYGRE